jgi:geranylgeranyl diphosphate/geranylgeranyl-bacteriochlorophyllide a reductase
MADVAIVGGGPAGALTACRLASAGARVVIFDASHPREKPCGGGVTGRALDMVAPVLAGAPLERRDVSSLRFEGDDGACATVPLAPGLLSVFSRTALDRVLVDAAIARGAELVAERVIDVSVQRGHVGVRTSERAYAADALVGADGANSLVRRRLGRPFARDQISIGTGYFATGVSSDEIVIRAVSHPPGYIWSFPRADHLAIGICAQADAASAAGLKRDLTCWIERSGIASGAALHSYSWPIPSLGAQDFARDVIAGDRWLLVGDAAGLVDPITREGIFFALQSAGFAADALLGTSSGRTYSTAIRTDIYPELARAASLKAGFFRPQFIGLLVLALRQSSRIRAVMADLVAGRQPYRGLRRRLLATFELGLAARLLACSLRGPGAFVPLDAGHGTKEDKIVGMASGKVE